MAVDTQAEPQAVFVVAPEVPAMQQIPTVDPYALKLLLYAQQNFPTEYAAFSKELKDNRIPWSFDDSGFLERLNLFRAKIESLLREAGVTEAQLNTAVPKELLDPLVQELESQKIQQREVRSGFVHELVTKYVAALKKEEVGLAAEEEKALEQKIAGEYQNLPIQVLEAPGASQKIQQMLTAGLAGKKLTEQESLRAAAATKDVAAEAAPQLVSVLASGAMVQEAFVSPVVRKDVFMKIYDRVSQERPAASLSIRTKQARRLAQFFQAFTAGVAADEGAAQPPDLTGVGVFFQSLARSAPQKLVASLADRALSLLPQPARERLVSAVLVRSWERTVDQLTQKFGQALIATAPFQQAIEAGNKAFGVPVPSGGLKTIRNFFLDAAGALVGTPDETMLGFMELTRLNATLPQPRKLFVGLFPGPTLPQPPTLEPGVLTQQRIVVSSLVLHWQQFYLATIYPFVAARPPGPGGLRLGFLPDIGGWIIRLGTKKAAKEAGKRAAVAAAGAAVTRKAAGGLISKILGIILGGAGGLAGAVGGPLGAVLGWIGGTLIWGGIKLVGGAAWRLISGGWLASLFLGGPKTRWQDDLPLLLAAAPVVVLVLLFVFPWFLNLPQTQETTRMAALVNGLGGGLSEEEGVFGVSTIPPYNGPLPPASAVTGCPVSGGYISQCPGGSFSHSNTDAYDIAGIADEAPVRATHNGYVASYRDGVPKGQGSGFGNYVRLVGTTSSGERYFTTYAHLSGVSQAVIDASASLQACAQDPACAAPPPQALFRVGAVVGWANDTGFSTATHLHYQYNGPGRLQLPIGCAGFTGTCTAR